VSAPLSQPCARTKVATSANKLGRRFLLPGLCSVAVAMAVVTGGCTSSAGPGVANLGATTTTTVTGSPIGGSDPNLQQAYEAQLAYAQCMRTHGETGFPDPTLSAHAVSFGSGHIDQHTQAYESAATTCKRLVPQGGPPSPAQIQAAIAALLKNAECMRAHGVANFPDPVVTGHSIGLSLRGLDPNSPLFRSAQETCSKLARMGAPG
jgi:hypothetical protein